MSVLNFERRSSRVRASGMPEAWRGTYPRESVKVLGLLHIGVALEVKILQKNR
jgi:hypothetical protein